MTGRAQQLSRVARRTERPRGATLVAGASSHGIVFTVLALCSSDDGGAGSVNTTIQASHADIARVVSRVGRN